MYVCMCYSKLNARIQIIVVMLCASHIINIFYQKALNNLSHQTKRQFNAIIVCTTNNIPENWRYNWKSNWFGHKAYTYEYRYGYMYAFYVEHNNIQ